MNITVKERKVASATGNGIIRYKLWIPPDPRVALQLTHGMSEYIDRYDDFAMYLAGRGILVYGQDHAGHGKSTPSSPRGFFAENDGWTALVEDMHAIHMAVAEEFPAIPYILFGHSMGSFLARTYAARNPGEFEGYIFMGTAGSNPLLPFGKWVIRRAIKKDGPAAVNVKLNGLATGTYNKAVKKAEGSVRTDFDWISCNQDNVDAYVADSLCGFPFTNAGLRDLFDGLAEITRKDWASHVADKPILLLSGEQDPVGGKKAKGVLETAQALTKTGHTVECKIYPGARHELLNETNRLEVYGDIELFISTVEAMGERA